MAEENNWYYTMGGQQQGPAPLEHLKHWLTNGQLQPTELVWREGMPNWIAASQVPELQGIAPAASAAAAAGFPQQQAAGGGEAKKGEGDVVDAEFTEVKDKKDGTGGR